MHLKKSRRISDVGMRCAVCSSVNDFFKTQIRKTRAGLPGQSMKLTQATSKTPVVTSSAVSRPGKGSPNFRRLRWWLVAALLPWALAGNSAESLAAVIAYDTAANYADNATFIGEDGGTGFGNWVGVAGTDGQALVEFSSTRFVLNPTDGSNSVTVFRPLDIQLAVGETFSVLGFTVQSGSPTNAAALQFDVGSTGQGDLIWNTSANGWEWIAFQGTGSANTLITSEQLSSVSFTRTADNAYSLTVSASGFTDFTTSGSFAGISTGITDMRVFAQSANNAVSFSTLQVVPEPSTYAMLFAGGLTAAGAAIRRRRRQAASAS